MKNQFDSYASIWFWPSIIGILTLIGLLVALLADGFYDGLGALLLLGVSGFCLLLMVKARGLRKQNAKQ